MGGCKDGQKEVNRVIRGAKGPDSFYMLLSMEKGDAELEVFLNMLYFLHVLWLMNSSSYCSILIYNATSQIYIKAVSRNWERSHFLLALEAI